RKEREKEADHAIRRCRGHQACQHQVSRRGSFRACVWKPGVEWKDRKLHGEGGEKAKHDPHRCMRIERCAEKILILEGVDTSCLMMRKVESQKSDQHQQSAQLGKEEELDCRIDSLFASPNGDKEIHRNQHQFPGEIEKE